MHPGSSEDAEGVRDHERLRICKDALAISGARLRQTDSATMGGSGWRVDGGWSRRLRVLQQRHGRTRHQRCPNAQGRTRLDRYVNALADRPAWMMARTGSAPVRVVVRL